MPRLLILLKRLRHHIHRLMGEDAYERYLAHWHEHHPGGAPLDRKAFYKEQQERRWSGIKRCC